MTESKIYLSRGVSSAKNEIHQAIQDVDQGLYPNAFCKILPDYLTGDPESCILMHADGAGTKSSLAYLYWKETGELSVFRDIAIDSLVMNLDDLLCVGATTNFLLSNTIGRNKFFIPGEVIQAVIEGYSDIVAKMKEYGINIHLSGGETADVGDLVRTIIVDSTMMTRLKRKQVISLDQIQPGDCIIGFSSSGQAKWESKFNSGIGSNGLTAARHDCFNSEYIEKYPETFSGKIPKEMIYCGSGKISDPLKNTPLTLGQAVLSPTRTYAPLIKMVLEQLADKIHGIIHCSGGGQTKCLKFGKGIHYIKDNLLPIPAVFQYISDTKQYCLKDMYPVFNMGHRLEMFVTPKYADAIIAIAKDCHIEAQVIGFCEKSKILNNTLTIKHLEETIQYQG
jgi:phosphoribosylformylglycinamidine cyclo-ligase